jgi:hypothetical protein
VQKGFLSICSPEQLRLWTPLWLSPPLPPKQWILLGVWLEQLQHNPATQQLHTVVDAWRC